MELYNNQTNQRSLLNTINHKLTKKKNPRYPNRIKLAYNWIIYLFNDYYQTKKETIKHQIVARQTQTKNNLIFEKRTQPTKQKEKKII